MVDNVIVAVVVVVVVVTTDISVILYTALNSYNSNFGPCNLSIFPLPQLPLFLTISWSMYAPL